MFDSMAPKRLPLSSFEKKISQASGIVEEGLLDHLVETLNPKSKFIVEFGAGDGENFSFAKNLIEKRGFGAFLIEADPALSAKLKARYAQNPKVVTASEFLRRDNIRDLFRGANVPKDLAVLCIDVDGNDYHLWKELASEYHADIVCIEYNAAFGPDEEFVLPYDDSFWWKGDDYFGASFAAMTALGESLGYRLIHVTSAGDNLIFVRSDLAGVFKAGGRDFYQLPQYGKNGRARNGKGHPASKKTATAAKRLWFKIRYLMMFLPRKWVYLKHDPKAHRG